MLVKLNQSTPFAIYDRRGTVLGTIKFRPGRYPIDRTIERILADNIADAGEAAIHGQRRHRQRWVPLDYVITDSPAGLIFRARIYVAHHGVEDYDALFIIKPILN